MSVGGAEAKLDCQDYFTLTQDVLFGRIYLSLVYKEPH